METWMTAGFTVSSGPYSSANVSLKLLCESAGVVNLIRTITLPPCCQLRYSLLVVPRESFLRLEPARLKSFRDVERRIKIL